MIGERWREFVELIGVVAIVASLIFVGMEVRQERDLARTILAATSFDNLAALRLTASNPDFAKTYAKMLERPEDLTIDERIQVDSVLDAIKFMILRECHLVERNVFTECDGMVSEVVHRYFGNEYAQSWWRLNNTQGARAILPSWIDSAMLGPDVDSNLRNIEEVLEAL